MLNIVYVTRGLPHYRVPVIRELSANEVHCHVALAGSLGPGFGPSPDGARDGLQVAHLPRPYRGWRDDVIRWVEKVKPHAMVLEHGASLDFTWTLLLSSAMRGVPRVLWTHGIESRELFAGRKSLASWGRWWQLRRSDAVICYDEGMRQRLGAMFPRKVIGCAPNSTDGRPIVSKIAELAKEDRSQVRDELGLAKQFYLLALGRLVREKEFCRIVEVLSLVRASGLDAGAIVIGAGPEEARIKALVVAKGWEIGKDVVFVGLVSNPEQMACWLFCSDVAIHPGALGLAAVDCLFGGVPTITPTPGPSGPFHGPEWKYVRHGETGWLVDENSDRALAERVVMYLRLSEAERREMRTACVRYAQTNLGIDRLVTGLVSVLKGVCRA